MFRVNATEEEDETEGAPGMREGSKVKRSRAVCCSEEEAPGQEAPGKSPLIAVLCAGGSPGSLLAYR